MKIVYVRWLDAALMPDWTSRTDAGGLSEVESVGYLLQEDDKQIQLAQTSQGEYRFCGIQTIPKSIILGRRVLDKGKKE
jgi:hypothetical protein